MDKIINSLVWLGICFILSLVVILFHPFRCFPGFDLVIFRRLASVTMVIGGKTILDVYNDKNF